MKETFIESRASVKIVTLVFDIIHHETKNTNILENPPMATRRRCSLAYLEN